MLAGCGVERPDPPHLSLGASATWHSTAASLGYSVALVFLQQPAQGESSCAALPESTRLRVNGADISSGASLDSSGCLDTSVSLGPYLQVPSLDVEVEENGAVVAEGWFDQLAPGGAATLAVPADGQVRAGDEIVVVPPPELATSVPSTGSLCPLDQAPPAGGCLPLGLSLERLADGLHATMPAFTGRAAVFFAGTPPAPDAQLSCSGFASCIAIADGTLGPVFVTGVP
jgi:hypothetical protein